MTKPTIGGRVPQDLADQFEEFREEHDLSKTDALRRLLRTSLEDQPAETDGGEVAERVDELHAQQEQRDRRERRHDALIGVALVVGALVVSGVADGPLALLTAAGVGAALVVSSLAGYMGDSDE